MSESARKVASNWEARIFIEGVGEAERRLEVTPEVAGWEYLSFRTYTFRAGQAIDGESAADEMCMVLLSGAITMAVAGAGFSETWELSRPGGVFEGRPSAVYLPPDHTYTMTVHEDADCAYGRAPAEGRRRPRLISQDDVLNMLGLYQEGEGRFQQLHRILRPGDAERLTCVETITPEGGWSRWPEERRVASGELDGVAASLTNEVDYYRFDAEGGYGLQRLGTHDPARDEVVIVEHGDAVMVHHGSYPAAASPGARMWALAFRAGATSSPPDGAEDAEGDDSATAGRVRR